MTTKKTERTKAPKKKLLIPTKEEILAADRSKDESHMALKKKVRAFYDFQMLRMQAGGRTKKDVKKGEIDLHEIDQMILDSRSKDLVEFQVKN